MFDECTFLQAFEQNIKRKIRDIEREKEANFKVLNEHVVECLSHIRLQRKDIISEMNEFYSKKKVNLKRIRSTIKKSRELEKECTLFISREKMQNFTEELVNAGKTIMDTIITLQKPLNLFDEGQQKLVKYLYEEPITETSLDLKAIPRKIINTRIGFVALIEDSEIIKLFNLRCFVFDMHRIIDICTTFDNDLAFLQHVNNRFVCTIVDFRDNYKRKEICLPVCDVDPKTAALCVSSQNIIIRSKNSAKTYYFNIQTLDMKFWENDLNKYYTVTNHRAFHDGLCYRYGSKIYFYSSEREICYSILNKQYESDFISVYKDIIPRLRHDSKLFCYNDTLYIIDFIRNSSISMDVQSIFRKTMIWDYDFMEDRIIFCLYNREEPKKVYFQRYAINS